MCYENDYETVSATSFKDVKLSGYEDEQKVVVDSNKSTTQVSIP